MHDMNTYGRLRYNAGLLALLVSSSVGAQADSAARNVELAAVEFVSRKIPEGQIKLDPMQIPARLAHPNPPTETARSAHRSAVLASRLGADLAGYSDVVVCSEAARTCQMKGAVAYIRMSAPEIVGDDASITVTIITSPRWYETFELLLAREGNRWRVVKETQLGVS
jgi:hypothetical protein